MTHDAPVTWMPLPAASVADRVSTSSPVDDRAAPETSGKLRDAVEVYQQAYVTWVSNQHKDNAAAYTAAAAVIEADREAVRAEQAAEIARLKTAWEAQHQEKVKERKEAKLWFEQAQEAAAELAKFKALAETLAGALGEIAQPDYGYTDILERGCPPEKHTEYFCSMVTWRQRTAREALREYKEARDAS